MKTINLFQIVLIFLSVSTYSQDTISAYLDNNWEVVQSVEKATYLRKKFRDSSNVWMAYVYYLNGNIFTKNSYKSRRFKKLHGKGLCYYENGEKSIEEEHENGLLTGKVSVWYETGEIKQSGFYKNGDETGLWQGWYRNGQKSYFKNYIKGKERGVWEYYYESGALEVKNIYINNFNYSSVGFYENGVKEFSGNCEFGVRNGEWRIWNDEGDLYLKGNYENGLKEGVWIRYFKEGKTELLFKAGILIDDKSGGIIHRE